MSAASGMEVLSPGFIEKSETGRLSSTPINPERNSSRVGSGLSGGLSTRGDVPIEIPPSESRSSLASGYEQELVALNLDSDRASNTPTTTVRKDPESSGNITPTTSETNGKTVPRPFSSQTFEGTGAVTPTQRTNELVKEQDTRSPLVSLQNQTGRDNSVSQGRTPSIKDGDLHATSNPRPFSSQKPLVDDPLLSRDYVSTPQRSGAQSIQNGKFDNAVSNSRSSNLSRQNEHFNGDATDHQSRKSSADYRLSESTFSRNSQRLEDLNDEKSSSFSTHHPNNTSQLGDERKGGETPTNLEKISTGSGFQKGSDRGLSPSPSVSRQSNRVSFHENGMAAQSDYGVRPPSVTSTRQSVDVKHPSPTNEHPNSPSPSVNSHASRRTYDLQKALQMDELEVKIDQFKKLLAERDRQNRQQAEKISLLEGELAAEKERSKSTSSVTTNHPKEKNSSNSTDQVTELERRVDQLLMERENLITELNETKKELAMAQNHVNDHNTPSESHSSKQPPVDDGKLSSVAETGVGLRNFDPNHPSALKRRIADLESQLQDLQEAHHSLLTHESSSGAPAFESMPHMNSHNSNNNNHLLLQELRRENCLLKEEVEHFKKTYTPHAMMQTLSSTHTLLDGSLRQEMDDLKRDMHVMRDRSEQLAAENQRLRDQMKVQDKTVSKASPGYDNTLNHYRMERSRVLDDVNRLKRELKSHGSNTRFSSAAPYSANFNGSSKSKSLANLVSEEDAEFDQHSPPHLARGAIYKAPNPKDYASPYEEARSGFQTAGGASNSTRPYSGGPHRIANTSPTPGVDRMTNSAYSTLHKYNNKYSTVSTATSYLSERTSVLAVDPTHRRYGNGGDNHNNWDKDEEEDDGDLTSALLDENVDELLMRTAKLSPTSSPKRHGTKHRHRRHHHHNSSNPNKSRPRNGSISGDTASILSDADRELKDFPYSSAPLSGTETVTSRNAGFLRSEMRHPPAMTNMNVPTNALEPSHLRSFPSGPVRMSPQSRPHFTDYHGGLFPSSRDTSGNYLHTNPPGLTTENSRFTTIGKHPFAPRSAADISMGDVVKFSRNAGRISNGLVHYIGPLPGRNDMYLGVELDVEEGKHDGIYEGRRYFQCKRNKGVFVAFNKVIMSYGHTQK